MNTTELTTLNWLAVNRLSGIGPVAIRRCLEIIGNDISKLFNASKSEIALCGLTNKQIETLKKPHWEAAKRDYAWCEKNNCHILPLTDPRYPVLLLQIPDPPVILFVRGDPALLQQPQLAMVGSRNPTVTAKNVAEQFASSLVAGGLIITSGFALGIDAASHRGALNAHGKTLAVFGTGLGCIYPASHRKLADEILQQGALISEFPPDEQPKAQNFPRRNRIISGLSLGVLVIEAAIRSGSLITAHYAVEQGREVFAIPGSIHNPLSRGCHHLIRQGAKLVETAQDILEELGTLNALLPKSTLPIVPKNLTPVDAKTRQFLTQIAYEVTPMDVIMQRTGLTAGEVSSMLLSLELLGYVQNVPGGYVRITTQ